MKTNERWQGSHYVKILGLTSLLLACVIHTQRPEEIVQEARIHITAAYPGWALAEEHDFEQDTLQWFKTNHEHASPTMIQGDFLGVGRRAYAAVITRHNGDTPPSLSSKIVVISKTKAGWQQREVDTYTGLEPPVLLRLPPGRYTDTYQEKTLTPPHDVFVAIDFEVTEIVYVWNGSGFDKIWLRD